jgi:hypothetical protein
MDGSGVAVLIGLLAFVVFGWAVGLVIGWFGYRRHGWDVDYRPMGIGFVSAGSVALLVLLVTGGPWVVGVVFMGLGVVYLTRSRVDRTR